MFHQVFNIVFIRFYQLKILNKANIDWQWIKIGIRCLRIMLKCEISKIKNMQINHVIYVFKLIKQLEGCHQRSLMVEQNIKTSLFSSFILALIDILDTALKEKWIFVVKNERFGQIIYSDTPVFSISEQSYLKGTR